MSRRLLIPSLTCLFGLGFTGCIVKTADPSAKAATAIDPKMASSEYWFNRPALEEIPADDYDRLWNACEATATDAGFVIDRFDYRTGLLTTTPLISRQFFEFWKGDVVDFQSQADSDTTTHRRVVHFKIRKLEDGRYVCEIKAVVEHYAMSERRITAVYQYREAFSVRRQYQTERNDDGTPVRIEYWYAERRDEALELALAARLRGYLNGSIKQVRVIVKSD